jgi:hypothetical protein
MMIKARLRRAAVVIALIGGPTLGLALAGGAHADPGTANPYQVANTGGEPVNVRNAPSLGAQVISTLSEGATIDISCQTTGDTATGTLSDSSDIWDGLAGGGYISDLFASTAGIGAFTPGIPRCDGGGTPAASAAPSAASSPGTGAAFVALGDSYSSGEGTYAYGYGGTPGNDPCHRSAETYSVVYASNFQLPSWLGPVTPTLLACSGADTSAIMTQVSDNALGTNTGLVTLTAGGDDGNMFAGILKACLGLNWPGYDCWVNKTDQAYNTITGLQPTLAALYTAIKNKAPNAHIVVLTYPDIFPPTVTSCGPSLGVFGQMSQTDLDHIHRAIQHMDDIIQQAGAQAGVSVLDERNAFAGHDICTGSSAYVNGLNTFGGPAVADAAGVVAGQLTSHMDNESYHPNAAGYQQMAGDLASYIAATWP